MSIEVVEAKRFGRKPLHSLSYVENITEAFTHFLKLLFVSTPALHLLPGINNQHAIVHPVVGVATAMSALGLGNLVFMVRKDQVYASAMYIE